VHGPHHLSQRQKCRQDSGFNGAGDWLRVPLDAFIMRSELKPLAKKVSEKGIPTHPSYFPVKV